MTPLVLAVLLLLAAIETLASYMSRVYSEFGKILSHEVEENLDAWEEQIEPQIGLTREHAAISAAVLQQFTLGLIALEFGAVLFDRAPRLGPPTAGEVTQALLAVVLVVVFCNQLLPTLLFDRTRGRWAGRLIWPIRLLLWLMTPITVFVRFFFSVASLAEEQFGPDVGRLVTLEVDVQRWVPRPRSYDLVVVVYLHLPTQQRSAIMSAAARAVAQGGTLLIVGHDLENLTSGHGGPQDPEVLYRPSDLVADIQDAHLVVVRAETAVRSLSDGHGRPAEALDALLLARHVVG